MSSFLVHVIHNIRRISHIILQEPLEGLPPVLATLKLVPGLNLKLVPGLDEELTRLLYLVCFENASINPWRLSSSHLYRWYARKLCDILCVAS